MVDTCTSPGVSTGAEPTALQCAIAWVHPQLKLDFLHSGTTLIGRSADAGIQLSGSRVSRRHATVVSRAGVLTLRDEGSVNTPHCNGARVVECRLRDNDVVRVGDWVGVVLQGGDWLKADCLAFEEAQPGLLLGPRSRGALASLSAAASSDLAVVIEGPTGTGKDLLARAIHARSGRSGPFVATNCAAQPAELFEAHFFGHVRGAFTGALRSSPGLFKAAHKGTLFLDELPELSLAQQAKLLRAVEEGRVAPVGTALSEPVDVRIVSASQRPLAAIVEEGAFRADLLARLAGITLFLLPLCERREEVLPLFSWALARERNGIPQMSAGFVEGLCTHAWPLNVRELLAAARRCKVLTHPEQPLTSRDLGSLLGSARPSAGTAHSATLPPLGGEGALGRRTSLWFARNRRRLDRLRVELAASNGNLSEAARRTGISRQCALRLLSTAARFEEGGAEL